MATTTLNERLAAENARLKAEIERLSAEAATSRPLRRRLGGKLTDRKLKSFNRPGHIIGDGNNLLYKCGGLGYGCWIYRYKADGKARDIGLGGYPANSLAEARIARDEHNRLRNQGQDPHTERQRQKDTAKLVRAKAMTFAQCAEGYFQGHEKGWKSPKHARQWTQIVADYIAPVLGALPVQMVDTTLVMKVVEPLWLTKTETASRARQIIEAVLDWAKARGYRDGDNMARWRGHIETMLPKKSTVHTVIHHPALPWQGLPEFMARLQQETSPAALALQVTALCGLRTSETRLAQWSEFDFANRVWTIPASRMKSRKGHSREHRVPLAEPVVEILERLRQTATGPFVFAAPGAVKPFGVNGMLQVLARLKLKVRATAHGFRSCLKTWATEKTNFAHEVIELCLAHAIDSKVEKAYRRGDLFDKRRLLMKQWSQFCRSPAPEGEVVVPFTAKRA